MPKKYTIELNSREAVVMRVLLRREMDRQQKEHGGKRPAWRGVYVTAEDVLGKLQDPANVTTVPGRYPDGLCGNREDHVEHVHESTSLGTFWCHADQARRLPFAMERKSNR